MSYRRLKPEMYAYVVDEMVKRGHRFKKEIEAEITALKSANIALTAGEFLSMMEQFSIPEGITLPWGVTVKP